MQKRKPPYTSRICDEGLALDEPAATQSITQASTASPFRADDWLLYHQRSQSASGGRGIAEGTIFTRAGVLVVTVMQEGLMRPTS